MKAIEHNTGFAEALINRRRYSVRFLDWMSQRIDWDAVNEKINEAYIKGVSVTGRPSYDGLMLFKIELIRVWYDLSDCEVETRVNDRLSFSKFVGLSMEESCPSGTTLRRFRNTLKQANAYDEIMDMIYEPLENNGWGIRHGQIEDACLLRVRPRRRKKKKIDR